MAEQRSGIVRNAQGLNPDTLHDTAKGAMALMSMAQKRVRMIARVLAETLVKDWYLNIHALSRTHNARREKIRLHGKAPVDIDPSTFGERADMVIEVGVGSGGREMELMVIEKMLGFQSQVIQMQGGLNGPIVTAPNGYELLKRFTERAGFKSPELFWTDPATAPPEQPKPDPAMAKVEADAKAKEAELQMTGQMKAQELEVSTQAKQAELAMKAQADQQKAETEMQAMQMKLAAERELGIIRLQQERELAILRMAQEKELAIYQADLNHQAALHANEKKAEVQREAKTFRPGGSLAE
jgi:hypothetical protein